MNGEINALLAENPKDQSPEPGAMTTTASSYMRCDVLQFFHVFNVNFSRGLV